jgi:hypothetical protein
MSDIYPLVNRLNVKHGCDSGTHFATNMRLTCDILKRSNDFDFVIEISGDYIGTPVGIGVSYEYRGAVST